MKTSSIAKTLAMLAVLALALNAFAASGQVTIKLYEAKNLNGKQLQPGEYKVKWERHSAEADVTFLKDKNEVVAVKGKFVDRGVRARHTLIVTRLNGDGTETIKELRFEGKSEALILDE